MRRTQRRGSRRVRGRRRDRPSRTARYPYRRGGRDRLDADALQVDEDSHPDLFWAIRGGGGNFGVATRFRFRLHELPGVVGGMLLLPATPQSVLAFVAEA